MPATALTSARTKPNFFYANSSMTLVLFLIGTVGVLALYANHIVNYYKENIEILVEIKNEAEASKVQALQNYLRQQAYARPNTIKYTTKEAAAAVLRRDFGDDSMAFGSNPLYNTISFCVNAPNMQPDTLRRIAAVLKAREEVSDVSYLDIAVNNIAANMRIIQIFTLVLSLVFVFIALNLINNTVKLALYSNRFLIKTMQLVGASWGFIIRPYMMQAYRNGLFSGLIAVAGLAAIVAFLRTTFPSLQSAQDWLGYSALFIGIIMLGVALSGWSTRRCVQKYLRMQVEDLY